MVCEPIYILQEAFSFIHQKLKEHARGRRHGRDGLVVASGVLSRIESSIKGQTLDRNIVLLGKFASILALTACVGGRGVTPGVGCDVGWKTKGDHAALKECRDIGGKDRAPLIKTTTSDPVCTDNRQTKCALLDGNALFCTAEKAGYCCVIRQHLATDQDGQETMRNREGDVLGHGRTGTSEAQGGTHFVAVALDPTERDGRLEIV